MFSTWGFRYWKRSGFHRLNSTSHSVAVLTTTWAVPVVVVPLMPAVVPGGTPPVTSLTRAEPMTKLRLPHIFNLRRDPFERADYNSNTYFDWMVDHVPQLYQAQALVAQQIANFIKYPPRQKPASFNLDEVMAQVSKPHH